MRITSFLPLVVIFLTFNLCGQRNVTITQKISLDTSMLLNEKLNLELIIPIEINPHQNIIQREFSVEPDAIIKDSETGELKAYWNEIDCYQQGITEIDAITHLTISRNDVGIKRTQHLSNTKIEDRDQYLKIASDKKSKKLYKKIAESLVQTDKLSIVGEAYKMIKDNYVPMENKLNYGTFTYVSTIGNADYLKYAETLSEVLKLKSIPSVIQYGIRINADGSVGMAYWPKIFISEYGWFYCDPFHDDITDGTTRLDSMQNNYIVLTENSESTLFDYNPAKPDFMNSITYSTLYSDNSLNDYHTAYNHFSAGEYEKSKELVNQLIAYNPKYSLYHNLNAWNSFMMGDSEESISILKNAYKLAKGNHEKKEILYSLANVFGHLQDKDNCYNFLNEAVSHGYNNVEDFQNNPNFNVLKDSKRFFELLVILENPGKL